MNRLYIIAGVVIAILVVGLFVIPLLTSGLAVSMKIQYLDENGDPITIPLAWYTEEGGTDTVSFIAEISWTATGTNLEDGSFSARVGAYCDVLELDGPELVDSLQVQPSFTNMVGSWIFGWDWADLFARLAPVTGTYTIMVYGSVIAEATDNAGNIVERTAYPTGSLTVYYDDGTGDFSLTAGLYIP